MSVYWFGNGAAARLDWGRLVVRDATGLLVGIAFAAGALLASPTLRAATYKWVDENGVVHYTDRMPPEEVNRGTVELNKEGITVRKTEPALTPEQRRLRELEAEKQKQVAKEREEGEKRDRALLSSYTNEGEIDLARTRGLATIDAIVQSVRTYNDLLVKRRTELVAQKKTYGDKPFPASLEKELEHVETDLVRQNEMIAQKKHEAEVVAARYDGDKQRWRELNAARQAEATSRINNEPKPAVAPGATSPPVKK